MRLMMGKMKGKGDHAVPPTGMCWIPVLRTPFIEYIMTASCRRKVLLRYFGEDYENADDESEVTVSYVSHNKSGHVAAECTGLAYLVYRGCGRCDNCQTEKFPKDFTKEGLLLMSAIQDTGMFQVKIEMNRFMTWVLFQVKDLGSN